MLIENMAGYTTTFLGVGVIWDKEDNRALCRFSKDGKFTTRALRYRNYR